MIIDFMRSIIGAPPAVFNLANLPALLEYLVATFILIGMVYLVIHSVFSLMSIFKKGR